MFDNRRPLFHAAKIMKDDGSIAAYISLGSNLGQPESNLRAAVAALARLPGVRPGKCSPVYFTEPQGLKNQPWFANQVVQLYCPAGQDPAVLLQELLDLESKLGRERATDMPRNAPRIIDIDLLLLGDVVRHRPESDPVLPHPRLQERAFVLAPLLDIAPDLILPDGRWAREVLRGLDHRVEGRCIYQ